MVIGFAIKSGLALGAIYYIRESGVWGDSKQTEKLYADLKAQACPHVKKVTKQLPFDVPALPRTGELSFLTKHYYNEGVKSSIRFVHMLPCYAGQLIKKTKDTLDKALEAPPAPVVKKE